LKSARHGCKNKNFIFLIYNDVCMRITIDTSVDSPEDIRKVIALLSSLGGRGGYSRADRQPANIFDSPSPSIDSSQPAQAPASSFSSMFGSADSAPATPAAESSYAESAPAEEEHYDESVRVIPY
jgi:hypothetical protein